MDKKEALKLLKQALNEIPKLLEQHYENQGYKLWISKIETIIKAGLEHEDYLTFNSARGGAIPIRGSSTEEELFEYYINTLKSKRTAIKSIIQKYEILGIEEKKNNSVVPEEIFQLTPPRAFISHGKESAALRKLTEFIETLGIEPLIVKKKASLDKDLSEKVNLYLNQADFVIILATGDDEFEDKRHPRQNVIHEIGLAQKTHTGKIIYLLEDGAEFPSNIRPKVWESFKQRNMMNAFLAIVRELRAYGILNVTHIPFKEQFN